MGHRDNKELEQQQQQQQLQQQQQQQQQHAATAHFTAESPATHYTYLLPTLPTILPYTQLQDWSS